MICFPVIGPFISGRFLQNLVTFRESLEGGFYHAEESVHDEVNQMPNEVPFPFKIVGNSQNGLRGIWPDQQRTHFRNRRVNAHGSNHAIDLLSSHIMRNILTIIIWILSSFALNVNLPQDKP